MKPQEKESTWCSSCFGRPPTSYCVLLCCSGRIFFLGMEMWTISRTLEGSMYLLLNHCQHNEAVTETILAVLWPVPP